MSESIPHKNGVGPASRLPSHGTPWHIYYANGSGEAQLKFIDPFHECTTDSTNLLVMEWSAQFYVLFETQIISCRPYSLSNFLDVPQYRIINTAEISEAFAISDILHVYFNPEEVGKFLRTDTFLPFWRDSININLRDHTSDTIWCMNRLSRTFLTKLYQLQNLIKYEKPKIIILAFQFINLTKCYAWKIMLHCYIDVYTCATDKSPYRTKTSCAENFWQGFTVSYRLNFTYVGSISHSDILLYNYLLK
jgi:hypothetical protein